MYLRRFADEREQVMLIDREDPAKRHRSGVAKACREAGFYEIPADDLEEAARAGHDSEMVEKTLADIEGTAAIRIEELLADGCPPSKEVRFRLSLFLGLQSARGGRFRRTMDELARILGPTWLATELSPEMVRDRLILQGEDAGPARVAEVYGQLTGPGGEYPAWRQGNYVQESLRHALAVQQHLFSRTWRVLEFAEPCLITSDEPVAVLAGEGTMPMGVADSLAVWVPLDRQHALAMTLTGTEGRVITGPTRARRINQMVADQAERWIVCHPDDQAWIPDTLGPRMEWRDEVLGACQVGEEIREQHALVPRPVGGEGSGLSARPGQLPDSAPGHVLRSPCGHDHRRDHADRC